MPSTTRLLSPRRSIRPQVSHHANAFRSPRRAFTLIELLVVVAIIAILISILLPALGSARKSARAVKCGANLKDVGTAFSLYLAENNAVYPPSYVYPTNWEGSWGTGEGEQMPDGATYGYSHWSFFLYNKGAVKPDVFTCPEIPNGGAPRTNPGGERRDWEGGQVDDTGSAGPNPALQDKQAPRIAFAANAVIVPRNKFTRALSKGERVNQCVSEARIRQTRSVILAAELSRNWKLVAVPGSGGLLCKSHRPIHPFEALGGGKDIYNLPLNRGGGLHYAYDEQNQTYGLLPDSELAERTDVIDDPGFASMNAIGRNHPGGDKFGGASNFLYTDGSVRRRPVYRTLWEREWGAAFYSLSGGGTEISGNK